MAGETSEISPAYFFSIARVTIFQQQFPAKWEQKMKIALNGATTMRADLTTDIKAASAAGYELIEIWAAKLREFLRTNTVGDLKNLLTDSNLEPYSINSIEHITFRNADDYAGIKAETEELSRIAAEIGCPYVVVVPGKLPENASEEKIVEESVKVLNELADIAEKYNVGLAFEFLGQADCSVQTLDLDKKIIEQVNRENVGLVIDTFHFYAGNSTFEAIETLDPKKLFIFHINDAEDLPKGDLTDAHRLYPGEGILPIKEIKEHFDEIGYDRMVSIEIFRPEYWNDNPFDVAKKAKAATEKVLGLNKQKANT
jgi:2-keto-myo-inositol isomerase